MYEIEDKFSTFNLLHDGSIRVGNEELNQLKEELVSKPVIERLLHPELRYEVSNRCNVRWSEHDKTHKDIDAWKRRKQHDYRELVGEIIENKGEQSRLLHKINLLFSVWS